MRAATLTEQTLYAELLDRCSAAAFESEFPPNGSFVRVKVKDRAYWYFQQGRRDASGKQPRKYVGPDTPENRQRVENHGHVKTDYRERRHLISMLRRSGFYGPPEPIGRILSALVAAGIFRMRGCLIGTAAYQLYGAMLGVRLPLASLQTGDLDLAQFTSISVAIAEDEQTPPLIDILKKADVTFRPVPHNRRTEGSVSYVNETGYRVEILTESRGPEGNTPVRLPAIGTYAQPLRFLDFLIYDETPAVVLHDGGILVNVPAPARYAIHKLIVAQRRRSALAKVEKDLRQVEALIGALALRNPTDLRETWREALARGPTWRRLLISGMKMISRRVRDEALFVFEQPRAILGDLELRFEDSVPRYDPGSDRVLFEAWEGRERVHCAISREAMDELAYHGFGGARPTGFSHNRAAIEEIARQIYLYSPIPADGGVLITTADVRKFQWSGNL